MATTFERLKQTRAKAFERLRSLARPNLGSHRKTTLLRSRCTESGSLLHSEIAEEHSKSLRQDFLDRFEQGSTNSQDQLRFLTVLQAVTDLDELAAIRATAEMEDCINRAFAGTGARCLAGVEIEIVNLAMLRRIGNPKDDETRKLDVLERLTNGHIDTGILIHFHGVVDLSNSLLQSHELRTKLLTIEQWRRSDFQVQLKSFYSNRTLVENLDAIASYITKGGNERLRYNLGFGRDPDDQLDAQIWRCGLGRADRGAETITDERSLTLAELALLDKIWVRLMRKRPDNRGYLIEIG